jgi:hypothetical protein
MTIGFGILKKWLINNHFPIAPHFYPILGLAYCQKAVEVVRMGSICWGKTMGSLHCMWCTSMHVVVFTHTQIRGLHFGIWVQMVDLAMETQKTGFVPLLFITQVYHECETMDWLMWNRRLLQVLTVALWIISKACKPGLLTTTIDARAANGFFWKVIQVEDWKQITGIMMGLRQWVVLLPSENRRVVQKQQSVRTRWIWCLYHAYLITGWSQLKIRTSFVQWQV